MQNYKSNLESSIFSMHHENAYYGSILQCMNIYSDSQIATAGVRYNTEKKLFELIINENFFSSFEPRERLAILQHEIKHISHGHLFRHAPLKYNKEKRQLLNIAADLSINQELKNLPENRTIFYGDHNGELEGKILIFQHNKKQYHIRFRINTDIEVSQIPESNEITVDITLGCDKIELSKLVETALINKNIDGLNISRRDYTIYLTDNKSNYIIMNNGNVSDKMIISMNPVLFRDFKDLLPNESTDYYYIKLLERKENNQCIYCGGDLGDSSEDSDSTTNCTCEGIPNIKHYWDDIESNELDQLKSAQDLFKRALNKMSNTFSISDDRINELLEYIDKRKSEINYKAILLHKMKASLPSNQKKSSWIRKNRRYGNIAPGTKNSDNPKLEIFIDTSGSISINEANEFLGIVDEFLKVGARKCNLNLFHTKNYYTKEYKKGTKLNRDIFENGGTCLDDSLRSIAKKRPDLSIILTDGYYSGIDVTKYSGREKFPKTIFIISKEGDESHPFNREYWARTIKIPR